MPARTGKQYLTGLREQPREVWFRGERVKDVEVQRLSVSAPVMAAEVENLPLNQRGIMNLAAIAPGIKTYAPQSGRTLPSGGAFLTYSTARRALAPALFSTMMVEA